MTCQGRHSKSVEEEALKNKVVIKRRERRESAVLSLFPTLQDEVTPCGVGDPSSTRSPSPRSPPRPPSLLSTPSSSSPDCPCKYAYSIHEVAWKFLQGFKKQGKAPERLLAESSSFPESLNPDPDSI